MSLEIALRVAAKFEDEFDKERAGLKTYEGWRLKVSPLVERWIEIRDGQLTKETWRDEAMRVRRVVELLPSAGCRISTTWVD